MKLKKYMGLWVSVGSMLISMTVQAGANGAYGGISLGQSKIAYTANNQDLPSASVSGDRGLAGGAHFGYQMNENIGVQFDYTQYHKLKFSNVANVSNADITYEQRAVDFSSKLILPVGSGFDAFATVGVAYVRVNENANSAAAFHGYASNDVKNFDAIYGLGVDYGFYPGWAMQIEWTQVPQVNELQNSNFIGAGLTYYFGTQYT